MNSNKIGGLLRSIRKDNNLTQKQFADKYNVTYQAVSKWENGINLPDITLLKQISKDFNISMDDLLDGEKKPHNRIFLGSFIVLLLLIILLFIILFNKNGKNDFLFKTISSSCSEFNVIGSIAYNNQKSSIYISHIDYCGGNDTKIYKEFECILYEKDGDIIREISNCKTNITNVKLEDYLSKIELNVDNYYKTCKKYNSDSLYLEVSAKDDLDKTTIYRIPLTLNDNCSKYTQQ